MTLVGGVARGRPLSLRVASADPTTPPPPTHPGNAGSASDRDDAEVASTTISVSGEGPGDRSWTWRFPGHRVLDALSVSVPGVLTRHSPFIGRLSDDGAQLRAIFGSLWSIGPLVAAGLGIAAAADTGGRALPPSLGLLLAITALASFDALSGFVATVAFGAAVVLSGAAGSGQGAEHPALVVIGLGFLWTSLPLVGSALRPFRRARGASHHYLWDRAADVLIASLMCGWVAQKLALAMDNFAGRATGVPAHADLIAVVAASCIAVRVLLEQAATVWYPGRLGTVDPVGGVPEPTMLALATGIAVRTATFGFIGHAFTGTCWQWFLGTALFLLPHLVELVRERCPTLPWVQRLLPRGLVELLVLLVAGTLATRYSVRHLSDLDAIRLAYVIVAVPPALLSLVGLVGGEAPEARPSWRRELAGLVVLGVLVALALQGWDY
jgi:hypothetical protein